VLTLAQEEAEQYGHGHIGTEHLLIGVLRDEEGMGYRELTALGVTLAQVRPLVEQVVPPAPDEERPPRQIIPTSRTKRVIELAFQAAEQQGQQSVGTEHLLLALATEGEGFAATVLRSLGADVAIRGLLPLLPEEGKEETSGRARPGYDQSLTELLDRAQDLGTLEGSAATGASHLLLAMAAPDSPVARFITEPDARLAEIPRELRDLRKRKEEAIESGDYENAARHRAEEKRLREEFHQAMNAWHDSLP
jgi:ATP-dependent Clp protease ATP-binding subunit ClpA